MHYLTSAAIAIVGFQALGVSTQSIDPNSVDKATRQFWCQSQITSCPLLCLQLPGESATTESNTCDPSTLSFTCVCSNGASPNASEYSQTIPYFICTEANSQCVSNCGGAQACQSNCRDAHPCGAQNPTRVNTTSSSSTMSATTTGSGGQTTNSAGQTVYTGFGGAAATTPAGMKHSAAVAAVGLGQSYGLGVVVAGIFAGFAFML